MSRSDSASAASRWAAASPSACSTAARASGDAVAPAVGAALGLAVAFGICVLLYRQAVRLNLATFFRYTAILLIVVAAGVLAYGLGDLQNAGVLPGRTWIAFDLTGVR